MPTPAPPHVAHIYTTLLQYAIIHLRYRLRCGEVISPDELHDYLDALHNVPTMLKNYGNWFVEENIDQDLAFYDQRWCKKDDSETRQSLIDLLERTKRGEFDAEWPPRHDPGSTTQSREAQP